MGPSDMCGSWQHLLQLLFLFLIYLILFVYFWPHQATGKIQDLSSPARYQTCTPCIGRHSLHHWTSRGVPTTVACYSYYSHIYKTITQQILYFLTLTVHPALSLEDHTEAHDLGPATLEQKRELRSPDSNTQDSSKSWEYFPKAVQWRREVK